MIEPSSAEKTAREPDGTHIGGINAMKDVRLNYKRVTIPSSDGITVPIRSHFSKRRKRTAVHIYRAQTVIRFRYVENFFRRLEDLKWLRIDVILKRTLRQAQSVRIVQSLRCSSILLKLSCPRLKRQPIFESRPRVAARHERSSARRGVRVGTIKSNPDAGQVRLAIRQSRGRRGESRRAVRAFRNSGLKTQRPLPKHGR